MAETTWDELMTPPDGTPEWVVRLVKGVKLADHIGDVWDSLLTYAPDEWKDWAKRVCYAEYVGNSIYHVSGGE